MKFDLKPIELETYDLMVLRRYLQNALNETNPTEKRLREYWTALDDDIKFDVLKYGIESTPVKERIESWLVNKKQIGTVKILADYGWLFDKGKRNQFEYVKDYICRKEINDSVYVIRKREGIELFYLDLYVSDGMNQHKFIRVSNKVDFDWILEYENLLNKFQKLLNKQ